MSPFKKKEWRLITGGITAPQGFQASGITAGLKPSLKRDLALLLAPKGAICAGTFTKSILKAACVDLCAERLFKTSGYARAVLINSGHANAYTGEQGIINNNQATKVLAEKLGLTKEEVLICSTGVIGEHIPIKKLIKRLDDLILQLSKQGGENAAEAIITTDLVTKQIAYEGEIDGQIIRIGGMAKGSGMIHPNMATMLAYITCDVSLEHESWKQLIQKVAEKSFNSITVDGDTSTNDTFLAFSAGEKLNSKHLTYLEEGLTLVAQELAKKIARDGEGASCLIEVEVKGTHDDQQARKIAKTICSSALVKTAIHGKDPNWGRIIAAIGRAGVGIEVTKLSLWLGPYQIIQNGNAIKFEKAGCSEYIAKRMKGNTHENEIVKIDLIVGSGLGRGVCWGCDLSKDYISINADYTT
ncbi:bifunctional glutamate N-acetyltransferase/amino-acid acetyltransferase ArgJ [Prochlorococcus sp. MIT 1341]|uniref:bifunctional glutamate N-acetyltransferase/amino-acid acetyltransferase ArgJ n=1 Tax=Prochlorococcus sp. MIT 1341 TaxID=3096221 RepID=UPI002A75C16B|nr:bifunctional glutamate N-acetyltransferase/amino-acid acetyltransferase ArgJ [Prochlorococcus sp. MIT 1341]